jgi:two-component system nitrate/nitrite response regulator NarL
MRILVADDHPLYRDALATQLGRLYPDAEVLTVGSLDELLAAAPPGSSQQNLFLVDFHMPGMKADGIAKLVQLFPSTPVAVVSGTTSSDDVRASIRAGARGFISKTATTEHLTHAIQLILAGGTSVPIEILEASETAPQDGPEWLSRLSPRERDVLTAVARGISNKQIGRELNLAEVTVKLHLRAIFRKMGAHTRAEAAVMASKAGLEPGSPGA